MPLPRKLERTHAVHEVCACGGRVDLVEVKSGLPRSSTASEDLVDVQSAAARCYGRFYRRTQDTRLVWVNHSPAGGNIRKEGSLPPPIAAQAEAEAQAQAQAQA